MHHQVNWSWLLRLLRWRSSRRSKKTFFHIHELPWGKKTTETVARCVTCVMPRVNHLGLLCGACTATERAQQPRGWNKSNSYSFLVGKIVLERRLGKRRCNEDDAKEPRERMAYPGAQSAYQDDVSARPVELNVLLPPAGTRCEVLILMSSFCLIVSNLVSRGFNVWRYSLII